MNAWECMEDFLAEKFPYEQSEFWSTPFVFFAWMQTKQATNQKFFTVVKDYIWDYQHIKQDLLI